MCKSMVAHKREVVETEKKGKTDGESKRYTTGTERGGRERTVFIVPTEGKGPRSIVRRLEASAGLPLRGARCSVAGAIKFFSLQQRIKFSCSTAMSL